MNEYTDQGYANELREIRARLLLMVGRVEKMIGESIDALVNRDIKKGEAVIAQDRSVNQDEVDLDALCLTLLACRQPMASDLRFVTFAMKMVTDLERIGDLAVNLSERAIDLAQEPPLAPYHKIPRMGVVVRSMVRDAIDAFVEKDAVKARDVLTRDDEVDELYHSVFRELLDLMTEDHNNIHRCIHNQSVAKYLERMGDHGTNLAEQVVFMLKGTDIRHPKLWQD